MSNYANLLVDLFYTSYMTTIASLSVNAIKSLQNKLIGTGIRASQQWLIYCSPKCDAPHILHGALGKEFTMKLSIRKITAALALAASTQASAAIIDTISFGNWTSNNSVDVLPTFSVGYDDGGFFRVNVGIDPASSFAGTLTGIFFDLGVDGFAEANIFGETYVHTDYATDTDQINGVTTINPLGAFDVILGYKPQASVPLAFSVTAGSLTLDDWTRVGLRWQSVNSPEGSDKVVSSTRTTTEVPEPGSLGLLAAGLLGLVATRRFAKQA